MTTVVSDEDGNIVFVSLLSKHFSALGQSYLKICIIFELLNVCVYIECIHIFLKKVLEFVSDLFMHMLSNLLFSNRVTFYSVKSFLEV